MTKPDTVLCLDIFAAPADVWIAKLQAAAQTQSIVSVILTGSTTDPRAYVLAAKPIITAVQALNIAVLVVGDTPMVGHTGADGLHVNVHGQNDNYLKEICAALKPKFIVGVGDIRTKDDVITAAEFPIDYVLFGNPDAPDAKGNELEKLVGFTSWWASIMELPCICVVPSPADEAAIIAAKPEFVAYILNPSN